MLVARVQTDGKFLVVFYVSETTMSEISEKIDTIRSLMDRHDLTAVRFKGVDWFSWATAGGSSAILLTNETGIAQIFITHEKAFVLTDVIDQDRILGEEVPMEYEIIAFPWQDPRALEGFVQAYVANNRCASDRPLENEIPLPFDFQLEKMTLRHDEIERYRILGREASEAMTEALFAAKPQWTEQQLASVGAKALLARGIDPALILAGNHRRMQIYRHPTPTPERLQEAAMMVFCARKYGLYANLTRTIFFHEPTARERENYESLTYIEAFILGKSHPGKTLRSLYDEISTAYSVVGHATEVFRHHQGGLTGYLAREHIAGPQSPQEYELRKNMALAWNPTLPGAKLEDTVVVGEHDVEILTCDDRWPCTKINGRARPEVLLRPDGSDRVEIFPTANWS